MSIAVILSIIASLATVLVLWMQGASRRRKENIWKEFKFLEDEYRKALAIGDPSTASYVGKQMMELRAKYKFLGA